MYESECDLHRRQWQRVALWPIAWGKRVAELLSKAYAVVLYTFTNWRKVLKEL